MLYIVIIYNILYYCNILYFIYYIIYIIAILTGARLYLIVVLVLIWIYPLISDVELLFIHLVTICMSSLEKENVYFSPLHTSKAGFLHLLSVMYGFLFGCFSLLSCRRFLNILDINPLSDI